MKVKPICAAVDANLEHFAKMTILNLAGICENIFSPPM